MAQRILVAAAIMGGLGVVLGAFGAHGLETAIRDWGLEIGEQTRRLATWDVAVRYQMYHALAMLAVGLLALHKPARSLAAAAIAFFLGTVVFSGCLYLLVFTGIKVLGAIVPLGGLTLIIGWVLLAGSAWRFKKNELPPPQDGEGSR